MNDKEVEQKLILLAAGDPKTAAAQLMLRAADVIGRLRAEVNYERARADLNTSGHADEINTLRLAIRRLAEQDATLSVCEGNVTVDMDDTLTDAEREAVESCIADDEAATAYKRADILRGLLKRLGGDI